MQAKADRQQQMFLRGMSNGVVSERDRLLTYTAGEIYQEMSLYIEECRLKEEELNKYR